MVLAAAVAYAGVELAVGELTRAWHAGFGLGHVSHSASFARRPLVSPGLEQLLAVAAALGAAFVLGEAAFSKRRTTEAWRRGALGEQATARFLEPLEAAGYVVLHDRRIPGSRANIDHVVVGPSGVWVIESKNWSGKVSIKGSRLLRNGRNEARALEEANREAEVVRAVLREEQLPVRPVLCIHGAAIDVGWFSSSRVDGVRICSGRRLRKLIEGERSVLGSDRVRRIADCLEVALP